MIAASRSDDLARHKLQQLPTPSDSPIERSPIIHPFENKGLAANGVHGGGTQTPSQGDQASLGHPAEVDRSTYSILTPSGSLPRLRRSESHVHAGPKSGETLGSGGSRSEKEKNTEQLKFFFSESTNKPPRKLSKEQILELASAPLSPSLTASLSPAFITPAANLHPPDETLENRLNLRHEWSDDARGRTKYNGLEEVNQPRRRQPLQELQGTGGLPQMFSSLNASRPLPSRTVSTPPLGSRKKSSSRHERPGPSKIRRASPPPLEAPGPKRLAANGSAGKTTSMAPESNISSLPMPPLSIPTYLQLELDAERQPSGLGDYNFESSAIKFERLRDFLLLPAPLEHLLWFGTFACIDAWLSVFTILPLRFLKALWILMRWWTRNALKEIYDLIEFVYVGTGRLWRRSRDSRRDSTPSSRDSSRPRGNSKSNGIVNGVPESPGVIRAWPNLPRKQSYRKQYQHRRTRSTPSLLLASHKADLLKGLLVVISSIILLQLDPSRMYHNIRGQAAIKLYVIYNGLEVGDRLLSAVGQDVLECLFSREVLDRDLDGRSRIIRPAWMFLIALMYNVAHTAALLYQVITLNVAVNSYSNALLTLLLSNQFVEIKAAVFKKVEKDNLFQLTCADVVERFQLWLMLLIIAMRNMVEVGGISISISNSFESSSSPGPSGANTTGLPFTSRIWPASFSVFPKFTGQILTPFIIVLGSEMIVDWIKHAYIGKFNDTKPQLYRRYLDILAKDYYTHAFGDQNLMKRIGLPVLPLACLFVRAAIQTYHMFLATHMPLPLPSPATSLVESASASSTPATRAALGHVDHLIRRALGRSSFPAETGTLISPSSYFFDDAIAFALLLLVLLVVFVLMLAAKLVLGIVMLKWARSRFKGIKERERGRTDVGGTRLGVSAMVEVDDEKRRYIYEDDIKGYQNFKNKDERMRRQKEIERERGLDLDKVTRYDMVAKRIW
jgi:hypothetical protein